jgi:L-ascorbate metabolism protein UlaG (beta-lactamase superfamily)
VGDDELVATLINHASVLLQHGGVNIITDPIYSERASPVQFVGPKRKAAAGVTFENLPTIHIVLISHNHYDHLDDYTIKQLKRAHNPIFITPLGNCKYISSDKCIELDWWQSHKYNDFNITLTPAKHWSKRGLFDYNKSLWGSFIISMPNKQNIFFSGDTAYGSHFKNIASKFHNIVLAMLPIGAYRPDFIMKDSHASPAESVLAHIDLSAKKSLGIHYGTFELSDDDYFLPIKDLTLSKKEMNIKSEDFVAALNGEQLRIKIK